MNWIKKLALSLLAAGASLVAEAQNTPAYTLNPYTPNDGGLLFNLTANGKWGIIQLGSSDGGGTATPKLYDVENDKAIEITVNGRVFGVSDVSDDGNIVVGSYNGKPASYNRKEDKLTTYKMRKMWSVGGLGNVTPDGKWAVGYYNGYKGLNIEEDSSSDLYYSTLLVNVETGDTIATPGLPKKDMAHLDQHAMVFNDITPDGRYVIGMMSWFYLQPNSGFMFVYDTQTHTYRVVGFTEQERGDWTPATQNLYNLCDGSLSPDGHWLAGMAYITEPIEGSIFFREYGIPYRYDLKTSEIKFFDDLDTNMSNCVVDNAGTLFANPNTGSPLRDFRVLFQDKHWISFSQICQQYYGFDFALRTGFERTGTISAISGDGSRFVAYPDPLGESYYFDLHDSFENVCAHIDLLDKYTITPAEGSVFSQLSTVEINFGRNVQVLGTGKNVHLYKADGTKVADGLTAGNQGLQLKTGSKTTVNAVFRTRLLDDGEGYYVTIDAGSIAVGNDAERVNKEIRVSYKGRKDSPVSMQSVVPEAHAKLKQFDNSTSYILMSFDCPVAITDNSNAYLLRLSDKSVIATLNLVAGSTDQTKHQVLLYPSSSAYLYEGEEYKVVVEAGSVSDCNKTPNSFNERIEVSYHGSYIRAAENDAVLFSDDFSDPAWSYANWLRYEGDKLIPTTMMQSIGFADAENFPWQFGMADDESYSDMFAGSHSMYSPAGQSDDWLVTPQITLPAEGAVTLSFDAQSYIASAKDELSVYVFEEEFDIPYLSDDWMNDDDGVRKNAVLLEKITLKAGASQETTAGEWTHYSYDLSKWAGKSIYLCFVNQNTNQSIVFLDNVLVERDLFYSIRFKNAECVINQDQITIAGQFVVKTSDAVSKVSLTLRNADGVELSNVTWSGLDVLAKDKTLDFTFDKPLSLLKGKENPYSIDIEMGDKKDVYRSSIANLTFQPVKRVVLEEVTGIDCPNCPLGIKAIEKCEKAFGDRFIPISIHTYTGDPYAGSFGAYSDFLGLSSAPSARINRTNEIYYPMVSAYGEIIDSYPGSPLWFDVVGQQLNEPSLAELGLTARLSQDGSTIDYESSLRYAIDASNQQLSLFVVVLEDGLVNYQANTFGNLESDVLGEWGSGGTNSAAYAYPVIHNDVVRSVVGQSFSGTIGFFPSTLEAGKDYSATFSSTWPSAISDVKNAHVVAMLIDSQTGEVLNAAKTRVLDYDEDAIRDIEVAHPASDAVYTLSGVRMPNGSQLQKGLYIMGGKKFLKR